MIRLAVLLLSVASLLLAQRRPLEREGDEHSRGTWVIDVLALDPAGRPVTDLKPSDFEASFGGRPRAITSFSRLDTVQHVSITAPGMLPALGLTPDEIHPTFVAIVDDVSLSPKGVDAVKAELRAVAANVLSSGGRMAILRAAGGTGALSQNTGDSLILNRAIDALRYRGEGVTATAAGRATWQAMSFALDGLPDFPGRKVVAVISQNPCAPSPQGAALSGALRAAHTAGAAVYAMQPGVSGGPPVASPCPLNSLARDTGGQFGGDLASFMQQEQSYYAVGIPADEDVIDVMGRWSAAKAALLTVKRPGVTLRSRSGFIRNVPQEQSMVPEGLGLEYLDALRSPFAASELRVRMAAVLSGYGRVPVLQLNVALDPRELTFIHDLENVAHGGAVIGIQFYREQAPYAKEARRDVQLDLKPDELIQALEHGVRLSTRMELPGPGPWQILVAVADVRSSRTGSASQFVDVPELRQGKFGISGVTLTSTSPPHDPTALAFHAGQGLTFAFTSFNETAGADRRASLEIQSAIFSGGHVVLTGTPSKISFELAPLGARREIESKLTLDSKLPPGDYLLQVTVQDLLASGSQSNVSTQYLDFEVLR